MQAAGRVRDTRSGFPRRPWHGSSRRSCLALSASASAEDVALYRGRTVTCYVGYGVGGAYDLYAREISRFLARHIPGEPKIAVENMPGASSMVLANYLAQRAPRDGTVLGAVNSALIFDPLFSALNPKRSSQEQTSQ